MIIAYSVKIMPQGAVKSKKAVSVKKTSHSSSQRSKSTPSYRNAALPAKKKNATALAKIHKQSRKNASGLTANLEKRLAERAGYTEMLGAKGGVRREDVKDKSKSGRK